MRTARGVAVLLVIVLGAAGCGGEDEDATTGPGPVDRTGRTAPDIATGGWLDDAGAEVWAHEEGEAGAAAEGAAGDADIATSELGSAAEVSSTGEGVESAAPAPSGDEAAEPSSGLRAGSVDDNAAWADYLRYREEMARLGIGARDIAVDDRRVVTVVDSDGQPLLGAVVRAGDQEVRTAADGRALLFGPLDGEVEAVWQGVSAIAPVEGDQQRFVLDVERAEGGARLDLHFLIDTTGSMSDEIDRLKDNAESVARRIASLPSGPDLHLGMTVYRDRGDAFVTRTFDFTSDVEAFAAALDEVQAGGGGDVPEDLNAGLHDALHAPTWRGDDTVKLLFLIADAAPHLDYGDGPDYVDDVRRAAQRGVKISPVASSGLDDVGELVFRQLAQVTMGRFTFLTYGADGASPGETTSHHVSEYAVLALDDLVVRMVEDELGHLAVGGQ
ncbi:MAG: VWA domain-containing protein [Actinomycetota bacterium]|nr:VWA domain-containing protein [Actinomycetota bacterium]